jgi:DnaJ family protein A protein 2
MPVETELYDTLGIAPDATENEIKKAYRNLAKIHHPDKGGDEDMFKNITAAYEVLRDKERRDTYDRFGKNGFKGGAGIPSDIFSHLFGGKFGGIFNMFRDVHNATRKEQPVVYKRQVTLEELCTRRILNIKVTRRRVCACQKDAAAERKCTDCGGSGRITTQRAIGPGMIQRMESVCAACRGRGVITIGCGNCSDGTIESPKIFNIYLTPDMHHGYQYKFPGDGNETPGVLAGDFIVMIIHAPHEQFTTQDKNLIYNRKTTLKEALCGYAALVLHPSGENISLEFPGVIPPNGKKILYGKGLDDRGNLTVVHDVVFPDSLTDRQIRKLGEILN